MRPRCSPGCSAWWLVARTAKLPAFILPSPLGVWRRFLSALADGTLALNAGATLVEILLGLVLGVGLATILGYLVARSRSLERVLSPYLVASQAVPLVAIAPLLVIWFGPGMFSKVLICAMIVFFPVLVNTIVGVRAVPAALHDLMQSLHASRAQILVKLEIPAALPVFLGGLRIGATLSVIGAVVGELVGADRGPGIPDQRGARPIRHGAGVCGRICLDRPGPVSLRHCGLDGKPRAALAGMEKGMRLHAR